MDLSKKYNIRDIHAGFYICNYGDDFYCNKCKNKNICDNINKKKNEGKEEK